MAVCLFCWDEAQRRAAMVGSSVAEQYEIVLRAAEHCREGGVVRAPWHPHTGAPGNSAAIREYPAPDRRE